MELRRFGKALLRLHIHPIVSLLAPGSNSRLGGAAVPLYMVVFSSIVCARRNITSTTLKCALKPVLRTSAAPRPSTDKASTATDKTSTSPLDFISAAIAGRSNRTSSQNKVNKLINSWESIDSRARISPNSEKRMGGGFSSAEILKGLREHNAAASGSPDFGRMARPGLAGDGVSQQLMAKLDVPMHEKTVRLPMKLDPSTGRTVYVSSRIDVMRAFKMVEISCARNNVRKEAAAQRFHERPGLKRKRLKRQRWRKRFLDGFKAVVSRVTELRKQGW